MLLSYAFANFHSFADRATVSLVLNQRDTVHGWDRQSPSGERVTTALAVLGANGAGKSSLVKVGPFLGWFLRDSFNLKPEEPIAFMPHQAQQEFPAEFELEADGADGVRWRYVLRTMPDRVLHEALYRRGTAPGERYGYVFVRDWVGPGYTVKQQGFGLADSEAAKVRPNVSLISWGRQYGAATAVQVSDFLLTTNLTMMGRSVPDSAVMLDAAAFFSEPGPLQQQMRSLLKGWDLGLSDVRLQHFDTQDPHGQEVARKWFPMGVHASKGRNFELPFVYESSGTQTAFLLLWRLLPVLSRGGLAFIDELENDLHPHMIEPLLRLFHDPESNPHGAQIIFTCQSPEVLKVLQRTQVVFVEKDDGASIAYRGDDIEGLTSAHNLYAKYMAGALGAVPQV
nr:ATP-binding protein [uncultured Roseateles sp.]